MIDSNGGNVATASSLTTVTAMTAPSSVISSPAPSPSSRATPFTPMHSPTRQLYYNDASALSSPAHTHTASDANSDRWTIAVRVRPLGASVGSGDECLSVINSTTVEFPIHTKTPLELPSFHTFHRVFGPSDSQAVVMASIGKPIIDSVLSGYNACMLAYGQTGSGKSFTMNGALNSIDNEGLIPRTIRALLMAGATMTDFTMTCSYVEVYNEDVYDLLSSTTIKTDCTENSHTQRPVMSLAQAQSYLLEGQARRKTAATNKNAVSSRSHAVFTLNLSFIDANTSSAKCSKLTLVDLAGSECSEKAGTAGQSLKEGSAINTSLLALKQVIAALVNKSSNAKQNSHVNYRDSKLTMLLQSCLNGHSKVTLIANISSANNAINETANTLRFCECAKSLKIKASQNASNAGMSLKSVIVALSNDSRVVDGRTRREAVRYLKSLSSVANSDGGMMGNDTKRRRIDTDSSPGSSAAVAHSDSPTNSSTDHITIQQLQHQLAQANHELQSRELESTKLQSLVRALMAELETSSTELRVVRKEAVEIKHDRETVEDLFYDIIQQFDREESISGTPMKSVGSVLGANNENQPLRLNALVGNPSSFKPHTPLSLSQQSPVKSQAPLSSVALLLANSKKELEMDSYTSSASAGRSKTPFEFASLPTSQRNILQPVASFDKRLR